MARDLHRAWLKLERIHCYDEGDGWGSAEPYLWTVFFKVCSEVRRTYQEMVAAADSSQVALAIASIAPDSCVTQVLRRAAEPETAGTKQTGPRALAQ